MKIISNEKNFITSLKIFLPFGYEFFFGYEDLITNNITVNFYFHKNYIRDTLYISKLFQIEVIIKF